MALGKGDRVALLTSGGDAPGMNSALRGAARVGAELGLEVVGVEDGYVGLMEGRVVPLDIRARDEASRRGGTLLGTARSKIFPTSDGLALARRAILQHRIRALLVIGGNGSLTGARTLRDAPTDARAGKRTLVVRFGPRFARVLVEQILVPIRRRSKRMMHRIPAPRLVVWVFGFVSCSDVSGM